LAKDDTLSECKSQNAKLLDYLCKKDNLSALIKYATQLPQNPDNHDEAHRYSII